MLSDKQLGLSDNYLYLSEEEQEKQEKQEKKDKKPFDPNEVIEWMLIRKTHT